MTKIHWLHKPIFYTTIVAGLVGTAILVTTIHHATTRSSTLNTSGFTSVSLFHRSTSSGAISTTTSQSAGTPLIASSSELAMSSAGMASNAAPTATTKTPAAARALTFSQTNIPIVAGGSSSKVRLTMSDGTPLSLSLLGAGSGHIYLTFSKGDVTTSYAPSQQIFFTADTSASLGAHTIPVAVTTPAGNYTGTITITVVPTPTFTLSGAIYDDTPNDGIGRIVIAVHGLNGYTGTPKALIDTYALGAVLCSSPVYDSGNTDTTITFTCNTEGSAFSEPIDTLFTVYDNNGLVRTIIVPMMFN